MKISPTYRLPFKRRYRGLTDYKGRLKLLLSKQIRLVVRTSLKHTRAQIIEFYPEGDRVIVSSTSQELNKFGWEGSTSNVPAAYLVGLLIGKKALKKNIKSMIFDIGVRESVKGSRIYAVLKGVIEAGLNVSHSPDILPPEERIKGKHIVDYAQKLKKDKKSYKKQFSKTDPEKIGEMFEKVKSKIIKS